MFKNNFVFDAISDAISKVIAEKIDPSVKTTDALQGPVPGGNDNGIRKPKVKLAAEEVEELDELSKGTLKSYAKKASSSTDERSASNLASRAAAKLAVDDPDDDGEKDDRKSFHRSRGISRAIDKLTKEETHDEGHPDEVEDKELVRSMVKKAALKSKEVAEATDTETKDASGKVTGWQHTGDWKKSTGSSIEKGKGKVAHLSDLARKKTVKLAAEEVELDEAEEFTHGKESLSYGIGTHPNVAKELHKHAGKIESIFHNTEHNAMAAVVHATEDGVHGDHHVLHFIKNKLVHTTTHPTFGGAEAHGVKTVTTKKGVAHLNKMHGLMKEESLDEISKSTYVNAMQKATDPNYTGDADSSKIVNRVRKQQGDKFANDLRGVYKGHWPATYGKDDKEVKQGYDKISNRTTARVTAAGKANKQDVNTLKRKIIAKEEVEELDEISKSTLGSYVKKATKDARIHGMIATDFEHRAKASRKPSYKETAKNISDKYKSRAWKREAGIGKAVDKLTKEENEE